MSQPNIFGVGIALKYDGGGAYNYFLLRGQNFDAQHAKVTVLTSDGAIKAGVVRPASSATRLVIKVAVKKKKKAGKHNNQKKELEVLSVTVTNPGDPPQSSTFLDDATLFTDAQPL